jgi:outer membrane protein
MNIVMVLLFTFAFQMGSRSAWGEPLTLYEIYQYALHRSDDVKIAKEDFLRAEQERRRSLSAMAPQITLSGTSTSAPEKFSGPDLSGVLLQPNMSYGGEVTLKQSLYSGGKNVASLRFSERGIEVAGKNYASAKEVLLLKVAKAYYGAIKAQKNVEAQQHNVERLTEHRRLSGVKFRVGEAGESLMLRAETELANAEATLVSAENELFLKRGELQILANLPELFDLEEPPLPEMPADDRDALLEIAFRYRNDIIRSRLEEMMAHERVAITRGSYFPTLTLQGTYFNREQDPPSIFFIKESWSVEGRIEMPIFDGGLRAAEMAQAKGDETKSQLTTMKLKKEIALDATQAYQTFQAITRVLSIREKQMNFATKNYDIVSKQFSHGLANQIDLLDANQALVEAEKDLISSKYDRHLAIIDLQRSSGAFLSMATHEK